jgi:O-antigen/teichoic acid export membrane protein
MDALDNKIPPHDMPASGGRFSNRLLAKNTAYNLAGQISPFIVAVVAVPFLIKGAGTERFGVLSMAWMVMGYFNLFDLGVGLATTKFVAEFIMLGKRRELGPLVLTSLLILLGFGLCGGILAAALSPWLVHSVLNITPELQSEALVSFFLMSASVPIVILAAGARGILEADQRFGVINAIRIPAGSATFLAPLFVMLFSHSLVPMIAVLVLCRMTALVLYLIFGFRILEIRLKDMGFSRPYFRRLLSFGGWITVGNLIAPLMGNMDRFFIGSILTLTAVTYYVTPFDTITKLFIIPIGLVGVLFPAFSAYSASGSDRLPKLHDTAIRYILLFMSPIVIVLVALARPIFDLWLGHEIARHSAVILQILGAGILFSSVGRVPQNAIQAVGRPDLASKRFLIELPIYIPALLLATRTYGIVGAASVWTLRLAVDTTILFYLAHPLVGYREGTRHMSATAVMVWSAMVPLVGYGISLLPALEVRIGLTSLAVATLGFAGYRLMLRKSEREKLSQIIRRMLPGEKEFSYLNE